MLQSRHRRHLSQMLLVLGLATFLGPVARAESVARLAAAADVVVSVLNMPNVSEDDLLRQIVTGLRQKAGICKTTFFLRDPAVSLCLIGDGTQRYQGKLGEILTYAVKSGKIDSVEGAILSRAVTRIDSVHSQTAPAADVVELRDEPSVEMPDGDGIPLPPLLAYRKNKANFAALRKAKNSDETLPKDLLSQLSKTFPREMRGVGAINAEQYFAAQIGRLDLNRLSALMISAADFLVRPDARIVFYPANHDATSEQLRVIEQQEMELARSILSEEDDQKRAQMRSQLQELESRANQLNQDSPVDQLMVQRAVKSDAIHSTIVTLAQSDQSKAERARLKASFETLMQQLNDIDAQLGQLIRTQQISPEDVQRFAFNTLKSDFKGLMQESPFNQLGLQSADALLAAWVAGDISSDAMRVMSTYPGLQETHISVWDKALSVSWSIGKTTMMFFPSTAYIAIAISIFEDVRKTTQQAEENKSNETHIIPLLK